MEGFKDIQDFKKSVVTGTGILFLVRLILFPITLAVSITLARLLEPVHFGIYGILVFFIFTSVQISELGLIAFLVQEEKTPTPDECKTVFTLRFLLSLSLLVIIWIIFPFIRKFFNLSSQASFMIKIFSLVLLAEPFSSVSRALLQRRLLYKKIGILDIINVLSSQIVAVIFAILHFGAWSLIIASIFSSLVTAISYFIASPWNLGFNLDKEIAKRVFKFGSFFQLSSMTAMLRDNIIAIFGGIAFGLQAVGYLSWAYNSMRQLSAIFSETVGRITFPAVSRIQDNAKAVSSFFSKSVRYVMIFTAPATCLFFVLSYEIIVLVFKPKWIPAIPAIIAFGILNLISHFVTIGDNVLKGLGKVRKDFLIMVIWTATSWMIALCTAKWLGYNAIALGWSSSTLIPAVWIINIINRNHPIDLRGILNPLLAAAISAYLVSLIKHTVNINIYILILLGVVGLILYIFILFVLERKRAWHEMQELTRLFR